MTTIMTWGNSSGIQGRCDDRCHNAKKPQCDCMCGGRYHGANRKPGGLEAEVRKHGEEVLKEAKARAERDGLEFDGKGFPEIFGLDLFGTK